MMQQIRYFDYVNIDSSAEEIHKRNIRYGFKDGVTPRTPELVTMLINTELAEAFEEIRSGHATDEVYFRCSGGTHGEHIIQYRDAIFESSNNVLARCPMHRIAIKPEGFPIEIADAFIRILDCAPEFNFNLQHLSEMKMAYNDTRPIMHGKAS